MTTEKELRELDLFCAIKVFGYTKCRTGFRLNASDGRTYYDGASLLWWADDCGAQSACWSPTTDPAAAMAVLEKCAEKTESSECLYLGIVGKEWVVGLESMQIEAVARTLPMAICLFAKKICQEKPSSPRKADNEK